MSDKDQLLKQQREEIEKLKKELQDASKPSSMFSVFKNTMKRNVHDFFIREDKMKTMDSKIKDLESKLAQKEEELSRASAELFAANLTNGDIPDGNDSDSDSEDSDDKSPDEGDGFPDFDNMDDDFMRDFPQNREAAVKRYFGKIDLTSLAGTHPEIETPQPEPQPADIQQDKQPEEPKEQPQPAEAPVQQQNPQPVQQPQQHPQLHIEKDDDDDYDSGYNSFETSINEKPVISKPVVSKRPKRKPKRGSESNNIQNMLHEIAQEENKAPEPAADTMPDIGTQADELPDIDLNEPLGEPLYEDLPEAEEDVFSEPKLKISKRPERKKRLHCIFNSLILNQINILIICNYVLAISRNTFRIIRDYYKSGRSKACVVKI